MYSVYILESMQDGSWYIGSTDDVTRRLTEHNDQSNTHYTGKKQPWKLLRTKDFKKKSDAISFERYLKKTRNKQYIETIIQEQSRQGRDWF